MSRAKSREGYVRGGGVGPQGQPQRRPRDSGAGQENAGQEQSPTGGSAPGSLECVYSYIQVYYSKQIVSLILLMPHVAYSDMSTLLFKLSYYNFALGPSTLVDVSSTKLKFTTDFICFTESVIHSTYINIV